MQLELEAVKGEREPVSQASIYMSKKEEGNEIS